MHASTNMTIKITASSEGLEKIARLIEDTFGDDYFSHGAKAENVIKTNEAIIEENYEIVWVDDVVNFVLDMARLEPECKLSVKGNVDCSESSGEYQDFVIEYADGEAKCKFSDWYTTIDMDECDSYEEFCEYNDLWEDEKEGRHTFSEEQYEEYKKHECMYVLSEGETIVTEVPLPYEESARLEEQ